MRFFSSLASLKSPLFALTITIVGVLNSSMYVDPFAGLLSAEDFAQERTDADHPALSSSLQEDPGWESFNTWSCFSARNLELECSELDFGAIHVPTLRVIENSAAYDFSLDPEPNMDCEQIRDQWRQLLDGEPAICTYAAYLQDLPADSLRDGSLDSWTLWIVNRLKTSKGYWSISDHHAPHEEIPSKPLSSWGARDRDMKRE
jgi:hypothetical protein